jgi:hypothetical protein
MGSACFSSRPSKRSPSSSSSQTTSCPKSSRGESCARYLRLFPKLIRRDRCEPALQGTLANLTFQGLLTSTDGREVARKLVTALIEQQIGQELGVS